MRHIQLLQLREVHEGARELLQDVVLQDGRLQVEEKAKALRQRRDAVVADVQVAEVGQAKRQLDRQLRQTVERDVEVFIQ